MILKKNCRIRWIGCASGRLESGRVLVAEALLSQQSSSIGGGSYLPRRSIVAGIVAGKLRIQFWLSARKGLCGGCAYFGNGKRGFGRRDEVEWWRAEAVFDLKAF
ncbi:hypothetical protein HPP92_029051 [Vanilla planifolia]|uniref:Uncharacterized protein n=1 Tax=Vanilla planifolia TaxID=51239 RepID=A0A835U339_VANPL|nr:hypothetical protein HPP92_029051 [Vanilla planifolia]KAG0446014.1 hypothetical protein HPP92_029040 [Vanilla planifolia]